MRALPTGTALPALGPGIPAILANGPATRSFTWHNSAEEIPGRHAGHCRSPHNERALQQRLISRQRGDRQAPADQAVISALTWRNEVERRVSGRVRGVSEACQGRCR